MEHKTVSVPNNFYCMDQTYNFGETKLFGSQCYKPDISLNDFADLSHIPLQNLQKSKNYILQKETEAYFEDHWDVFNIIWRLRLRLH